MGTSAALPTIERAMSCTCIERNGELLVFDAGEGSQLAFVRAHLGWNKPMRIFITHMHGDHCIGLLGLVQSMSLKRRTEPLEVYGPAGIDEFLATNLRALGVLPPFLVTVSIVDGTSPVVESDQYDVLACKAQHGIEAYSYVLAERPRPGRFYPEKAESLGVPKGAMWHQLQAGQDVVVDGKTVRPSDVLGEQRPGLRVGISGDTRPTKDLVEFFAECDWLVFESTFLHELHDKAIETSHTTAREAGELAKAARAKNLVLTHFSARHTDESELVDEAKKVHSSVTGARDGLEIELS